MGSGGWLGRFDSRRVGNGDAALRAQLSVLEGAAVKGFLAFRGPYRPERGLLQIKDHTSFIFPGFCMPPLLRHWKKYNITDICSSYTTSEE